MTATATKTFGERANTWVQTIGIISAGVWAGYTFIYKEVFVPKSAPINTVVTLSIQKEVATSNAGPAKVALTFTASAQNPSQRRVDLFNSIWLAYGSKVNKVNDLDLGEATQALNSDVLRSTSRYYVSSTPELIALGRLFDDDTLESSEKVGRTEVIYLPGDTYDSVELVASVPNATNTDGLQLKWKLSSTANAQTIADAAIYVASADKPDELIEASEDILKSRDFSFANSRAKISLVAGDWEASHSPATPATSAATHPRTVAPTITKQPR